MSPTITNGRTPQHDLLPMNDAAREFGISRQTIYRRHEDGEITIRKIGRRSLVSRAEMGRLIRAKPRKGTSTQ